MKTTAKLGGPPSSWIKNYLTGIDPYRNVRDEQFDVFVSRLLTDTWTCLVLNINEERITHAMVLKEKVK